MVCLAGATRGQKERYFEEKYLDEWAAWLEEFFDLVLSVIRIITLSFCSRSHSWRCLTFTYYCISIPFIIVIDWRASLCSIVLYCLLFLLISSASSPFLFILTLPVTYHIQDANSVKVRNSKPSFTQNKLTRKLCALWFFIINLLINRLKAKTSGSV